VIVMQNVLMVSVAFREMKATQDHLDAQVNHTKLTITAIILLLIMLVFGLILLVMMQEDGELISIPDLWRM